MNKQTGTQDSVKIGSLSATTGSAPSFWSDMRDEDTKAFHAHVDPMQREWEYRVSKWHGTHARTKKLQRASDAELRLLCGELTAQEVRTIRAVLNFILPNEVDIPSGQK